MKANTRAAVLGGLAATFVVAVSLAPRLASQDHKPSQVQVRPAAIVEATTTTLPQVEAQVPTTAAAKPLDERVTKVEQRVDTLENPPTTTTTYWQQNPDTPAPVVRTLENTPVTTSTTAPQVAEVACVQNCPQG